MRLFERRRRKERRWASEEVLEGNTRWCIGWLVRPLSHPVPFLYLCGTALGLLLMLGGLLLQRVTLGSPLYEISASPDYQRACGIAHADLAGLHDHRTDVGIDSFLGRSGSGRVVNIRELLEKQEPVRQLVGRIEHEKARLGSRALPAEWVYLGLYWIDCFLLVLIFGILIHCVSYELTPLRDRPLWEKASSVLDRLLFLTIVAYLTYTVAAAMFHHRSQLFGGQAQSTQAILGYAASLPVSPGEDLEATLSNCWDSMMLLKPSSVLEALNIYRYLPKS